MKRPLLSATLALAIAAAAGGIYFAGRKPAPPVPVLSQRSAPESRPARGSSPWTAIADPQRAQHERLELVRSIPAGLGGEGASALYGLLRHRPSAADQDTWWVVLNELLKELRLKEVAPDIYVENAIALTADPEAGEVARDYAVQHLVQWIAPVVSGTPPCETDPEKRAAGLAAIATAIQDPSLSRTTVPGTGLLALAVANERLDPAEMQPVWQRLAGFLDGVIRGDTPVDPAVRNAAIQAVARTGQSDHLPALRDLAGKGKSAPSLALASIHALGTFGLPEDRPLLDSLASSPGPLRFAARAALDRMNATATE